MCDGNLKHLFRWSVLRNIQLQDALTNRRQLLLIIQGSAGTGKSHFIDAIRTQWNTRLGHVQVLITAPTGTAAANICGATYQSVFRQVFDPHVNAADPSPAVAQKLQRDFEAIHTVIIDELSFLSDSDLLFIESRCRAAKASLKPFGGINIILLGDIAQLPPVGGIAAWRSSKIPLWKAFQHCIEFSYVYRQQGSSPDQIRWRDFLARLREATVKLEDWMWLQERVAIKLSTEENVLFDDAPQLFSTVAANDALNIRKLTELQVPVLRVQRVVKGVPCSRKDSTRYYSEGAKVRLTDNIWLSAGLVNGSLGTVRKILTKSHDDVPMIILVAFESYCGPPFDLREPTLIPIGKTDGGFPLTLAYGMTIHSSQGCTLKKGTVDIGDKEFAIGLSYVAYSRIKSFAGLRLARGYDYSRLDDLKLHFIHALRQKEWCRLRNIEIRTLSELRHRGHYTGQIPDTLQMPTINAVAPIPDRLEAVRGLLAKTKAYDIGSAIRRPNGPVLAALTEYRAMRDALLPWELQIIPIVGDGNCGFRAMGMLVYGEEDWQRVRREMRFTLMKDAAYWKDIFLSLIGRIGDICPYETMLEKLSWDRGSCLHDVSFWWTTDCVYVASVTYQRPIIVFSDLGLMALIRADPVIGPTNAEIAVMCHVNGNHYVAIRDVSREFLHFIRDRFPMTVTTRRYMERGRLYRECC